MKDFDDKPTTIEIQEVKEHRKEMQTDLMHSFPGLTLFEYDPETKILQAATFDLIQKQIDVNHGFITPKLMDNNGLVTVKKVIRNKGCAYFQALNFKNALKKVEKNFK